LPRRTDGAQELLGGQPLGAASLRPDAGAERYTGDYQPAIWDIKKAGDNYYGGAWHRLSAGSIS